MGMSAINSVDNLLVNDMPSFKPVALQGTGPKSTQHTRGALNSSETFSTPLYFK